jgi:hypothetical protein
MLIQPRGGARASAPPQSVLASRPHDNLAQRHPTEQEYNRAQERIPRPVRLTVTVRGGFVGPAAPAGPAVGFLVGAVVSYAAPPADVAVGVSSAASVGSGLAVG